MAVPEPAYDWGFTAAVVGDRRAPYLRGKVVGGSSAVNLTLALRGVPADYDAWAGLGNHAWNWQQVLPYFRKLEDDQDEGGPFHGSNGPIPIRRSSMDALHPLHQAWADACRDLGFGTVADHNHPDATGLGPWPRNVRDGIRISTALAYLQPARQRLNLSIRSGCLAERVVFDDHHAVGVEVECGGGTQQISGRRITLCAGALVSPLLLMRSGIGPHATLVAHGITPLVDLPGVGANLVDHPWAPLILVPRAGLADLTALPAAVGLRYTTPGSGDINDMQMYFNTVNLARWPSLQALVHEPLVLMFRTALQRPQSRGRLTLTTANPHSPPTIAVNCLDHPDDLRRMVAGLRLAWTLACSPQLRPYVEWIALLTDAQVASDEALVAYLRLHCLTVNHPAGTARMGPRGDAEAVVDPELPDLWRGELTRGRCVGDADHPARQHQPHLHHDCRTGRGLDAGSTVARTTLLLKRPNASTATARACTPSCVRATWPPPLVADDINICSGDINSCSGAVARDRFGRAW